MIAFDKQLLKNTFLVNDAYNLEEAGFISNEQLKNITTNFKSLKTQKNLFIRFCLFLLGVFLYSSICGTLSIFGLSAIDSHWEVMLFIFALVGFVGQEFICAKSLHHYGYGIDDAAILGALASLTGFISVVSNENFVIVSLVILVISSVMYLRYLHTISIIIACISLISFVFFGIFNYLIYGKEIMPFALFTLGISLYFLAKKTNQKQTEVYYSSGINTVKIISLILIYISVNYYVVRELSNYINVAPSFESPKIPMAWLFYGFTILIPVVYIYFGIKNKDKSMFLIGLLCVAFSIFTIRFYNQILPIEIALTLGGILLFTIAYLSIRKLRKNESGITFLPDRYQSTNSLLTLQTLASASQFGINPEIKSPDSPMEFGGGGFSGGGAGESF